MNLSILISEGKGWMQMKYLFILSVIILAPNFYCKTASAGEIAEPVPKKHLLEEKEAESSGEILKQSSMQSVTDEQVEAGSSTSEVAGVDSAEQSELRGNNTGNSSDTA